MHAPRMTPWGRALTVVLTGWIGAIIFGAWMAFQ